MKQHALSTMVLVLSVSGSLSAALVGCSAAGEATTDGSEVATVASQDLTAAEVGLSARRNVRDPGVRGGPAGGGTPIAGLNENELAIWAEGRFRAQEIEATCDTCSDIEPGLPIPPGSPPETTNSAGLGARFNANVCTAACHAQPDIGGTSPAVNPAFAIANAKQVDRVNHPGNKVPFFNTVDGPFREMRFLFNPDGTRDGGVHQLFTVTGRSDAPDCDIKQPDFEGNRGNMGFRIPLQMFGLGLMEGLQDKEILAHKNANLARKAALGIQGVTNNSPNDGTIMRFGWKAQNKSVTVFAGEAYVVEVGVTNELNPQAKDETDGCMRGAEPNDVLRTGAHGTTEAFDDPLHQSPDWIAFSMFMRFTDQPKPVAFDASARRGLAAFNSIGCAECHVPTMKTRADDQGPGSDALRGISVNLFSDILVHHMGANLADNIIQGAAGPDMFRTTPLWGIGQRIFFLHDGRTKSLVDAIFAHFSTATAAHGNTPAYPASEANQVVRNFANLPGGSQQDLVNFLRKL